MIKYIDNETVEIYYKLLRMSDMRTNISVKNENICNDNIYMQ